jgi:hypothetical protein
VQRRGKRVDFYSNAPLVVFSSTKRYEWIFKREERKQRAQQGLTMRDRSYLNTSGETITWRAMPAAVAAPTTAVVEKWKGSPDARIFGWLHWAHWWTFASLRLVVNRDTPKSGPKINVFYINFRSSDIQSFYNFIEGNPMDCALIDVIFKGTQVSWLLKKVMRGLIFGPDFGVSRLAGGAGYCCLFLNAARM